MRNIKINLLFLSELSCIVKCIEISPMICSMRSINYDYHHKAQMRLHTGHQGRKCLNTAVNK